MAKKRYKRAQTCTGCGKTGHNRRRCTQQPNDSFVLTSSPSVKQKNVDKKTEGKEPVKAPSRSRRQSSSRSIFVQWVSKANPSKHVVDLKGIPKDHPLLSVVSFKEKQTPRVERKEVDFAALVREANQSNLSLSTQGALKKMATAETQQRKRKSIFSMLRDSVAYGHVLRARWLQNFFALHNSIPFQETRRAVLSTYFFRYVSVSIIVALILPFPAVAYYQKIKNDSGRVAAHATEAFGSLQSSTVAAMQANLAQAKVDLDRALKGFSDAQTIIDEEYGTVASLGGLLPFVGKHVTSRHRLLIAGQHVALGNAYLVKGVSDAMDQGTTPLTDRLETLQHFIRGAIPEYEAALVDLSSVEPSILPEAYQSSLQEFRLLFAVFVNDMKDMADLLDVVTTMIGSDDFHRYLVMFQNHHELRPTGGFLGAFAVVDVQKGKVLRMEVPGGGTYDLQGQLSEYVKPPLPLQVINKRWEFQDANWFPDFPASAEKMEWFYQHGRGSTVDGVIAINASVLERLLAVLGPIENSDYALSLDVNTALSALQEEVQVGYDREKNQPKAVIAALLDQFLSEVREVPPDQVIALLFQLYEALEHKEIQLYANDPATEDTLRTFGWTGDIWQTRTEQDYLMVVNTNLLGSKTDAKVSQHIEHHAAVAPDGSVIDTVIVRREHHGESGEQFYGVNNVNYVRVYVPEGSELLDAKGFTYPPEDVFLVPEPWYEDDADLLAQEREQSIHVETGTHITSEFGKTVFGNWAITPPGETSEVRFTYRLPFSLSSAFLAESQDSPDSSLPEKWKSFFSKPRDLDISRYSLLIQKQSGTASGFSFQIGYPEDWTPVWKTDDRLRLLPHGVAMDSVLDTDDAIGVVMERNS
ncbi:MAG TPA: hypothetical protein DCY48_03120 [Candidatus Magasanikbacteria bacterium]|nr:MAG: hypothetical protein A3I74_04425 [Candidatus Magasanikbacteria bacterium RIFCSPLOWO2_02_FULL_47_16]OGH79399.1 MAG: hypothetical protein A3C10_04960 [Candidatus Magasanikbacteria bacterium RIFCSPHIGHO2_02_FULL_48_18]OGH83022.1 MAG: hypothetical protein A3G08_01275 [Candidatus Magasanikbacteria bacterium RIFCSPLOWO2_12_FULL_47_9b]HAZ28739.1 hypothetical protein [Candidatus Magasanikbacteria bacterium]